MHSQRPRPSNPQRRLLKCPQATGPPAPMSFAPKPSANHIGAVIHVASPSETTTPSLPSDRHTQSPRDPPRTSSSTARPFHLIARRAHLLATTAAPPSPYSSPGSPMHSPPTRPSSKALSPDSASAGRHPLSPPKAEQLSLPCQSPNEHLRNLRLASRENLEGANVAIATRQPSKALRRFSTS